MSLAEQPVGPSRGTAQRLHGGVVQPGCSLCPKPGQLPLSGTMLSPRVNSRTDRAILRWPVGVARELGPPRPALGALGRSGGSTGGATALPVQLARRRVRSVSQGHGKAAASAACTPALRGSSIHCHGPCHRLSPTSTNSTRHGVARRSRLYERLDLPRFSRRPMSASPRTGEAR